MSAWSAVVASYLPFSGRLERDVGETGRAASFRRTLEMRPFHEARRDRLSIPTRPRKQRQTDNDPALRRAPSEAIRRISRSGDGSGRDHLRNSRKTQNKRCTFPNAVAVD